MPARLGRDEVYIVRTLDGSETLYSRRFGSTYHSTNGAVSESRHVFLHAGLHRYADYPIVQVLEFGFGTGLNAFLTYLFSVNQKIPVHYTGIEAFPIAPEVASQLDYPAYLAVPQERHVFLSIHANDIFSKNQFEFNRIDTLDSLDESLRFDCIFFDAFDPQSNESVWTVEIYSRLFAQLNSDGVLVTYCAQGQVRRDLISVGFDVERLQGAPGKREMIRAIKR